MAHICTQLRGGVTGTEGKAACISDEGNREDRCLDAGKNLNSRNPKRPVVHKVLTQCVDRFRAFKGRMCKAPNLPQADWYKRDLGSCGISSTLQQSYSAREPAVVSNENEMMWPGLKGPVYVPGFYSEFNVRGFKEESHTVQCLFERTILVAARKMD